MSIRVAIVEDDREIRDSLAWLFRNSPGFDCVGTCGSAEEAIASLPGLNPDVVLMDIHLPGISGIECVSRLKKLSASMQVCMLTVIEDDDLIFRSLRAGATGYLLKKTAPNAILQAVQDLHAGGSPMTAQIARKVVSAFADEASRADLTAAGDAALCTREREILDLLAQGYRYKNIADELGITIHTVRTFIRRLYEKLQVHSRMEAVIKVRGRERK